MDNQLEILKDKIQTAYCMHPYVHRIEGKVENICHPVSCEDCGAIVECPHLEYDDSNTMLECVDCGAWGDDLPGIDWDEEAKYRYN
jgi:hypothetical protein